MPKPKPHEFRIRMSPDLKAIIDDAAGAGSKNALINDWLWSKAREWQGYDDADRLADALRPALIGLSDDERAKFVDHAVAAAKLLASSRGRNRSRP